MNRGRIDATKKRGGSAMRECTMADAGPLRSQTLRGAAMKRNLSIGRSTERRLTFYPRGIDKKGHSIATFSRNIYLIKK